MTDRFVARWRYPAAGLFYVAAVGAIIWYPHYRGVTTNPGQHHVIEWQSIVQSHAGGLGAALIAMMVLAMAALRYSGARCAFGFAPFLFGIFANGTTFKDLDVAEYAPLSRLETPSFDQMADKATEQWVMGTRWRYQSLRPLYAGATFVTKHRNFFIPWMAFALSGVELAYEDYEERLSREAFDSLMSRYQVWPYAQTLYLYDPKVSPVGKRYYVFQHDWVYVVAPETERSLAKGTY